MTKITTSLHSRGIDVPEDLTAVVIAEFENWLKNSLQGKEHIISLCGFDWKESSPEFKYIIHDLYGRPIETLKNDQVYMMTALVAKGQFVPQAQVLPISVEKHGCDLCGTLAHCTREVTAKGKSTRVCNHCLKFDENSENRALSGGHKECATCTAISCEYHPIRDRKIG